MSFSSHTFLLICLLSLSLAFRKNSFNKKHRMDVISMVEKNEAKQAIPRKDVCHGRYFCSSSRDYPLRMMKLKLREAMRSGKISSDMFDREEGTRRQNLFLKDQREQRRYNKLMLGKESENHCEMEARFERPVAAVNNEGEMRFILNDVSSAMGKGRIFQTVQTGTCEAKGPSAPCGGGGSESYCQQEWTIHRLVALKVDKGKRVELSVDYFQFPSCCSCHLRL